jgi:hypothetical protein
MRKKYKSIPSLKLFPSEGISALAVREHNLAIVFINLIILFAG